MRSEAPKVLHLLRGKPLVAYPLQACAACGVRRVVVVVGHGGERVREACSGAWAGAAGDLAFAEQPEQRGTGDAVRCALPYLRRGEPVLVLSGDVPLLGVATLEALVGAGRGRAVAFATFRPPDPTGYGRVVRDGRGGVLIREQRDASEAELRVGECNGGAYCFDPEFLAREVPRLEAANAQGELYLTDLVAVASARGAGVATVEVDPLEVAGVNTPEQLAELDEVAARREAPGATQPAARAWERSCFMTLALIAITGIAAHRGSSFRRRVSSSPLMPGRSKSMRTSWGT
jgi:bifunctional UDP-N-acetylglucosamine pyrophosphorylase/glucosamine-1-phosphate N-acetyltransferase